MLHARRRTDRARGPRPLHTSGGKPKLGETLAATLRREAREEAQILLGEVLPFGYRLVESDPTALSGQPYAQIRAVALVKGQLPPAPDPATGRWYLRTIVPPEEAVSLLA